MNKLRYIAIALLLGVTLLTSCGKEFLDVEPKKSVSAEQIAQDPVLLFGLVQGMNSMMYNYDMGSQFYGLGVSNIHVMIDMMSDDIIKTNYGYFLYQSNFISSSDEKDGFCFAPRDFYYNEIHNANEGLLALKKMVESGGADEGFAKSLEGTLRVFRAYSFFQLVQLYGKRYVLGGDNSSLGIILRLDPSYTPMARSTVEESYEQINYDLIKGIEALEAGKELMRTDDKYYQKIFTKKNTIGLVAALGIAARINLVKGDYDLALKYAKRAIEQAPDLKCQLVGGKSLLDGFNNSQNPEWIWGYTPSADQNGYYYSFAAHWAYNTPQPGALKSFHSAVNRTLYDKLGAKDVRRKWFVCADLGDEIPAGGNPEYFKDGQGRAGWAKTGAPIKFSQPSMGSQNMDYVFMRLPEMYFIAAEACARVGDEAKAQKYLNDVMATRDPEFQTTLIGEELIDQIIDNKRIEFFMEGIAFYEMKRLGRIPDRTKMANFKYMSPANANYVLKQQAYSPKNRYTYKIPQSLESPTWQFAIPYDEITGNPLCEPNPQN